MGIKHVVIKVREKYQEMPIQAKLALWLTFCTLVQRGISVITVPIFTRIMDTEEYGRVSAYLSWYNIVSILCSFKLTAGVYNKGLSKYKEDQASYCLTMQYTTSIITILVYIVYLLLRNPINKLTDLGTLITSLMFLEVFFSTSMGFWSVRRQYSFKYKSVVAATLFYAFLNPTLGLIFVLNADYANRSTARIISTVLTQVIVGLFFYILNMKEGEFKFKKEYSVFAIRFNLPLIPHYFSEYILNQSDRVMIQQLCSYTKVAFYSVAYNAGMLMTIITSSLNQAITPWLYQSLDNNEVKHVGRVLESLTVLVLIPMIIFIALAPEAVYILAGSEYASAVYVIPPVAGSVAFLFLYTNFANIEFYFDYNKFTMYISMIGAALNILLNYFCIKQFGYVAAGYTTFFCYFVYCAGHYLFAEHIIKKKYGCRMFNYKHLLGLLAILVATMLIMSCSYSYPILRYGIIVVLVVIIIIKRKTIMNVLQTVRRK